MTLAVVSLQGGWLIGMKTCLQAQAKHGPGMDHAQVNKRRLPLESSIDVV